MDLLGLMISIEMSHCMMKFEKHAYRKKSLSDFPSTQVLVGQFRRPLLHLDKISGEGRKGEELKIPEILIGPVDGCMFLTRRNK